MGNDLVNLETEEDSIALFLAASLAPNTRRAFASDWKGVRIVVRGQTRDSVAGRCTDRGPSWSGWVTVTRARSWLISADAVASGGND